MPKVIVNNIVSLDGYYADSSGDPLVLDMDSAFDRANLESIGSADAVLLGRDSFEGFSAYWPHIADAPEPADDDPAATHALDETNREISRRYNRLPKVVVSDRGSVASANPWAASTEVVARSDIASWLTARSQERAETFVVFGSRRTWNALLARGLVDELHLTVSAMALGNGVPLFDRPAPLELLDVRRFDGSSNVQLRYRCRSEQV